MTAYALRRGARSIGTWQVGDWLAVAAVAIWSMLVLGALSGRLPTSIAIALGEIDLLLFLLAPPVVLLLLVLLKRSDGPGLKVATIYAVLFSAAIAGTLVVRAEPRAVFALPGLVVAAVLCARWPAAAVGVAFVLTGTFNTVEAFTPIPTGETVDVALAGLWVVTIWHYVFARRERPVWVWPGVAASMLYLAVTAFQIAGSESFYQGLYGFRVTAWYMLAFLLLAYSPWGPPMLRKAAKVVVVTALVVGAYAVLRKITGPTAKESELGEAASKYNQVGTDLRLFGSLPSGHHLAGWTAVVIPFCLAYALTFKDRFRWIAVAAIPLCLYALWASNVRTGLVGVVGGVVVVVLLYQLSRGIRGPRVGVTFATVIILAALGIGTFVVALGSNSDSLSRYSTIFTPERDPSVQARIDKWQVALPEIREHPWGQGIGAAGEAHARYGRFVTDASFELDNSYLLIAFSQGLVITGLFVLALVAVVLGLGRRSMMTASRSKAGLAIGATGTLVSFMLVMVTIVFVQGLNALAAFIIVGIGVGQFTSPQPEPEADAAA